MHPLQSLEWEEFKKGTGGETSRVDGLLVTWHKIPLTPWRVGYVGKSSLPSLATIKKLEKEARMRGVITVRMEPDATKQEAKRWLSAYQEILRPGRHYFTPTTFWLYLDKTEEEILAGMHPKGRYNIKLAQKHGVVVKEDGSNEALETFLDLMFAKTAKRHRFYARNLEYYRKLWAVLHRGGIAHLFTANYGGEVLAAWIVFKYDGRLYYPYGASSDNNKQVMAPSLLLWETVRWGKSQGCLVYDLWGAEKGRGYDRFKEQFGPARIELVGTWDVVVNPWLYPIYRLAEEMRWKVLRMLK